MIWTFGNTLVRSWRMKVEEVGSCDWGTRPEAPVFLCRNRGHQDYKPRNLPLLLFVNVSFHVPFRQSAIVIHLLSIIHYTTRCLVILTLLIQWIPCSLLYTKLVIICSDSVNSLLLSSDFLELQLQLFAQPSFFSKFIFKLATLLFPVFNWFLFCCICSCRAVTQQ